MILIISDNSDRTTTEVLRWIHLLKKKFIRINENEVFEISVVKKKISLKSNRNHFFLDDIHSVWFRRGGLNFKRLKYENNSINLNLNETQHWLEDYVRKTLEDKKHINKESNYHVNKLLVLERAKKIGLDIPDYYLSENTDDVIVDKTITKPLTGTPILADFDENYNGMMYTTLVEEKVKTNFFISFFQEKIEKDFEIRTFYLDGTCWSMAIFSQNDGQTKMDFRNYNHKKPNRNVRYKLPKAIEKKIHLLMQAQDLNCGSIDFIKSGEKYYFLEVNSIGQFANVSFHCNYELFKEIAEIL